MSYLFEELESKDEKATTEDKILLMGLQQAGKTAIKDVVFFGKIPGEVEDYMATIHYERQYLDEEKKSLIIDSGGQESYWITGRHDDRTHSHGSAAYAEIRGRTRNRHRLAALPRFYRVNSQG